MKATFWIKERNNPQLGTYWVLCGKMSKRDAMKHERPIYGDNIMHPFTSQGAYIQKIQSLRKAGERIQ